MALRFAAVASLFLLTPGTLVPTQASTLESVLNDNVISILSGEPEWLNRIEDLATQLNHSDHLRILPISGAGSVQAINDLIYLRAIDAALLSSDVLVYAEAQGLIQPGSHKIAYIADIASLPIVLVTRKDISSLTELAGLRICTGTANSAAFATGELLFGSLALPFSRVPLSNTNAVAALQSGKADAALLLGTEALHLIDENRFHILSIPIPENLKDYYSPALLTADVLAQFGPEQKPIETISTALTLAVFNWPKGNEHSSRLARLAKALWSMPTISDAKDSTNLTADVPGWQRHASAIKILAELRNNLPETQSLNGDAQ